MFKALDQESGKGVISLDPRWANQLAELRAIVASGRLVCPVCSYSVELRAGARRRRHFAHRRLGDCPYATESPVLLETRAVLYEWLVSKFGDAVTVEQRLSDDRLPRPVDCWVERKSGAIAYWILESGMRLDARTGLRIALADLVANTNWVFAWQMLREDADVPGRLQLTTTERELMERSEYDLPFRTPYDNSPGTLHYLDAASKTLCSYRGLQWTHPPHEFEGEKECHDFGLVKVRPSTGEFVHPGEQERLAQHQEEIKKRDEKARPVAEQVARVSAGVTLKGSWFPKPSIPASRWKPDVEPAPPSLGDSTTPNNKPMATCLLCKTLTNNWYYYDPVTQTCKCWDCYGKQCT